MALMGTIDLVPQYRKYAVEPLGSSTLMDVVSSGEIDRHIVLVPIAAPLPAWSLPLRVFSARIWLALLGAAVAYALAWRVVAGESLAASAAAALRAFSSCGGAPQDRVRATPQRLQRAAALLASAVVVVTVYQGRLFYLITNPQHEAEIETFDQLAKQKMTLLIPEAGGSDNVRDILRKIPTRSWGFHELKIGNRSDAKKPFALYYPSDLWQKFRSLIYPELKFYREMRESLLFYQPHIYSRRNWPLCEILKIFILQMEESGLIRKWKDDFNISFAMLIRSGVLPDANKQQRDDGPKVLALEDVAGHLQLLCAGLSASALVFCAELWRGHRAGKRLRRRSRRVRAQLSRRWRRICAGLRQAGAQMRKWGHCANATPLRSQLVRAVCRCFNRN